MCSSSSTISCSEDSDGEGLTCQDRDSCPFAEELSRIKLTVYFRTNYLLEDYTITPFYIREIGTVRPGFTCSTLIHWKQQRHIIYKLIYSTSHFILAVCCSVHHRIHTAPHFIQFNPSEILILSGPPSSVKPDKIDITKVEGNTFQWGYPATWSRPCPYFPLTFRVKVVQHEASCDSKEKVHAHFIHGIPNVLIYTLVCDTWPVCLR